MGLFSLHVAMMIEIRGDRAREIALASFSHLATRPLLATLLIVSWRSFLFEQWASVLSRQIELGSPE